MGDTNLHETMLSAVDRELRESVDIFFNDKPHEFKESIYYQLGWNKQGELVAASGKRLRPVMLLATIHALGLDWQKGLPAAAAVELVHNFSLVHDDIQDHSTTRRGRPTIWVKWGEAQAINVGDALLACAFLATQRLKLQDKRILQALHMLHQATLNLTGGQYLDLAFEKAESIPLDAYWDMVRGMTGALFGVRFALGSFTSGNTSEGIDKYDAFGNQMGIAFQVQDDYLGVFGDQISTGKSTSSDLMERKKSYPILYGLEHLQDFHRLWVEKDQFSENDVAKLKVMLEKSTVHDITRKETRELYIKVKEDFTHLFPQGEESSVLEELIEGLFDRIE
jgi:geranylgeranyl diphosphate synthase type I